MLLMINNERLEEKIPHGEANNSNHSEASADSE